MLNKILSASQIREADAFTIKNEPILSIDLMERASNAFVNAIISQIDHNETIAVLCGTGNNGGDGLAVARILMWKGYEVDPILCMINESLSEDCKQNASRIDTITTLSKGSEIPDLTRYSYIIDGLFGSGLNREVEGWAGQIIDAINTSNAKIFSIDIPSGMFCDAISYGKHIVQSDLVVSFQRPKRCFFFKESDPFIKAWKVVDIGLNESFIQDQPAHHFILDEKIAEKVKRRAKYSHKGTYGHALLIAGSREKFGAAILSGKGCLRSGIGLLTIHVPESGADIIQMTLPEAMVSIDPHFSHFSKLPELDRFNCIGIGPGLGTSYDSRDALIQLLDTYDLPLVLDADALNILSLNPELKSRIPSNSVLTPHPKEFQRLVGEWKGSMERLKKQIEFSQKYHCVLVLKDAVTVITDPTGNVYFNTTGNPGMATGGSGDVLTGIITGLMGQGYTSLDAALLAVYFHGHAGDEVAQIKGQNALLASDIAETLRIE